MKPRHPIPDGVETSATARIVGVLKQKRPGQFAPLTGENVNRVLLEVGDEDIPVIARQELADALSGMETGWALVVEGRLFQNHWSTEDGRSRMETAVEAERIYRQV